MLREIRRSVCRRFVASKQKLFFLLLLLARLGFYFARVQVLNEAWAGGGKKTKKILLIITEKLCKKLSHPHLVGVEFLVLQLLRFLQLLLLLLRQLRGRLVEIILIQLCRVTLHPLLNALKGTRRS